LYSLLSYSYQELSIERIQKIRALDTSKFELYNVRGSKVALLYMRVYYELKMVSRRNRRFFYGRRKTKENVYRCNKPRVSNCWQRRTI